VDQRVPELEHITHLPVNTPKRAAIQAPGASPSSEAFQRLGDADLFRQARRGAGNAELLPPLGRGEGAYLSGGLHRAQELSRTSCAGREPPEDGLVFQNRGPGSAQTNTSHKYLDNKLLIRKNRPVDPKQVSAETCR